MEYLKWKIEKMETKKKKVKFYCQPLEQNTGFERNKNTLIKNLGHVDLQYVRVYCSSFYN